MPRPVWKGSISFGLVTINIEMISANARRPIRFKLLHNACDTPIEYKRWCPKCNQEVIWRDVVKGIKVIRRAIRYFKQRRSQKA